MHNGLDHSNIVLHKAKVNPFTTQKLLQADHDGTVYRLATYQDGLSSPIIMMGKANGFTEALLAALPNDNSHTAALDPGEALDLDRLEAIRSPSPGRVPGTNIAMGMNDLAPCQWCRRRPRPRSPRPATAAAADLIPQIPSVTSLRRWSWRAPRVRPPQKSIFKNSKFFFSAKIRPEIRLSRLSWACQQMGIIGGESAILPPWVGSRDGLRNLACPHYPRNRKTRTQPANWLSDRNGARMLRLTVAE